MAEFCRSVAYHGLHTLVNSVSLFSIRFFGAIAMTRLDEYVKIAEAARIIGVSPNTLRAWAADGKILGAKRTINNSSSFKEPNFRLVPCVQ